MTDFALTCQTKTEQRLQLIYRPITSELLGEDGQRISLDAVGMAYTADLHGWPKASIVSPDHPGVKSREVQALKIQMGLKCNHRCSYCNQTARPESAHGTLFMAERFLEGLSAWFRPASADGQGVKIEFWGGEPFLYWDIMQVLGEELHRRYPKALFSVVTNGSLLDQEKVDWLECHEVAVAISHDGLRHRENRGHDPFDYPGQAAAIQKAYQRLRPKGLISFNCVLTKNNFSLTDIRDYLAAKVGSNPEDLPLTTEELVLPYNNPGMALSLHEEKEHTALRQQLFQDVTSRGAHRVLNVNEKLLDFYTSLAHGRPSAALGQRCGLDRADTLAVDLLGHVLTCQNTAATDGHGLGLVTALDDVRLSTAWHWATRERCFNCLVLQLCKGSCMRLNGMLWKQACANSFTYNLTLLTAAIFFLTGGVLTKFSAKNH